ncbi:MAG: hypothetical protein ACR2KK_18685, partial [Acidimicrobiales bacterium]
VLSAVVAAYVAAWCAYGLIAGSQNTASYVVIVSAVALAVAAADARVHFSRIVLAGLAMWGFGHLAGGLVALDGPGDRILYNAVFLRWGHFDNVVHAIGFGTSGIAVWEATRSWLPAEPGHRLGTAVVVCLLGQGVGAFNEVVEFWSTHLLVDTNVGGYENTGRDLVANLLGSAVAGWWVSRRPAAQSEIRRAAG